MKLITYLSFAGNCEEAMNFYKEALGADILLVNRMGDSPMEMSENLKDKIMHARMQIGENELYMSDTFDPATLRQGNNVSLSIQVDDTTRLENLFNSLSAGGTVTMPLANAFWGARFGMFVDKFGIHWMFNCELKKEPSLN
ncbi:MAG TPA: VOC family protein [Chitinophagaceae bacterium]|nr:VOC family protein [Chitinophagaceae bacterium]